MGKEADSPGERLMYHTCDQPAKFLPEVTEALTAFENQSNAQAGSVEARAGTLFAVNEPGTGRRHADGLQ